jgi:hypothetical protein
MGTETISPLRQRMIEDMKARKLCAGTQRGHIHSCKRGHPWHDLQGDVCDQIACPIVRRGSRSGSGAAAPVAFAKVRNYLFAGSDTGGD